MQTQFNTRMNRTLGVLPTRIEQRARETSRPFRSVLTVLLLASQPLLAWTQPEPSPDLIVKEFQFPPDSQQSVKVHVANNGESPSAACLLRLVVTRIAGTSVGRTTEIETPAIAAEGDEWLVVDASKILPKSVALKDTVFKLDIDPQNTVSETDETNNVAWHGLSDGEDPPNPDPANTQDLSTAPREQKLSCKNVGRRWQICGSVSRTRFVAGVGIRFNEIDPNGRIVASRSYENCAKLASDHSIPAYIRAQAAAPCKQSLQMASKAVVVR